MRKMVWRLDSAQNHSADATWGGAEWRCYPPFRMSIEKYEKSIPASERC